MRSGTRTQVHKVGLLLTTEKKMKMMKKVVMVDRKWVANNSEDTDII